MYMSCLLNTTLVSGSELINAYHAQIPLVGLLTEEMAVAQHLGGGYYDHHFSAVVPLDTTQIDSVFSCAKTYFSREIGPIFPTWKKDKWVNSATDIQALRADAEFFAPTFVASCRSISKKFGATANFGPGDQFALKKEASLQRKILSNSIEEGISIPTATQRIGDALRGTIIIDYPEQAAEIINEINEWAQREGGKAAWKNVFLEDRESGYVGIHGKIYFHFTNSEGEERELLSELQIHFRSIADGTETSRKERMHLLYETERAMGPSSSLAAKVSKLSFLSGLSAIGDLCRLPSFFTSRCHETQTIDDAVAFREMIGLRQRDTDRCPGSLAQLNQSDFYEKQLSVVKTIRSRLDDEVRSVVISGAPGSGKSELLHLALDGSKPRTFDLRAQFLDMYFKRADVKDPSRRSDVKTKQYQTEKFKEIELEWLNTEFESIKHRLIHNNNDTIIFDEFDLSHHSSPTTIAIANKMILLANACRDAGKKVVLIVHEQSKKSPEIMDSLCQSGFIHDTSEIVQTRFFNNSEQFFLLRTWNISGVSARKFIEQANGLPAAYLPILRNSSEAADINKLYRAVNKQIIKIYSVVKATSPHVADILKGIALNRIQGNSCGDDVSALLASGLVKISKKGTVVMPPLVRQAIQGVD